ncbi:HAD hydrolase-like protein [Enterococcus pseudoavium]|uniref:HAD hydrolase-like protein n=1 Tax=Enterococcus pseudoavium TaxID=44007 RepID=A0AAE4I597_9ENTE|nr:HAD hydrolase-like protein [Enterococcus pseudoavium]MDT2738164.1 HAD hydrolase-like protein [Enterococcus pseudoavium]MDT2754664.1 HAD hydrolase-like protein [Enterococcus pseudoavium]MDT2771752.1 HAD hydrolase-like protein [Enterococcus pseudoavium]
MKKNVLFDLDGTLTDSSEGILNSICYMMEKLGLEIPDEATLHSFIGPPLSESLHQLYGMSFTEAQQAVNVYREYYGNHGITQLTLYPGITEMLTDLSQEYHLAIATSKPEAFAKQIIETAGLTNFFSGIFGADLAGERSTKTEVLRYALAQLEQVPGVMIGDRKFDILGAKANRLKSIGVLYGFGDLEELQEANPDQIIEKVEDIGAAIREIFFEEIE